MWGSHVSRIGAVHPQSPTTLKLRGLSPTVAVDPQCYSPPSRSTVAWVTSFVRSLFMGFVSSPRYSCGHARQLPHIARYRIPNRRTAT